MRAKKKVLIITNSLLFGGVERLVVSTARVMMEKSRYYPIVCNLTGWEDIQSELESYNIEYYSLNRGNLRKGISKTMLEVRHLIKKCKPNIIHTHQFASDFFGALASLGFSIPVVSHIHNPRGETWFRRKMRYALSKYLIHAFIAVTEEKGQELAKWVPSVKDRVFILHNAIDTQNLQLPKNYSRESYRNSLNIPIDAFVIGTVGRLCWEKGYDLLLRAFKRILNRYPDAFLVIVGGGPEEKELKILAKSLSITSRMVFTGFRRDIAPIVSTFDLFVVSSREESFPLVSLEAMYLGIPTIITSALSSKNILSPGTFIVSPTVDGLAKGIMSLIGNKDLRKKIAKRGKDLVKNQFTMEAYVTKLEEIYNVVLNRYR